MVPFCLFLCGYAAAFAINLCRIMQQRRKIFMMEQSVRNTWLLGSETEKLTFRETDFT